MADLPARPLLNPVLTLRLPPIEERPIVVVKKSEQIVTSRLQTQRKVLSDQVEQLLRARGDLRVFGGYMFIIVEMFSDSLATTHTPRALFRGPTGTRLLGPTLRGYFAELHVDELAGLAEIIRTSQTIDQRCDISRIQAIRAFTPADALRRSATDVWEEAAPLEHGRGFIVWLAPFRTPAARAAVVQAFTALAGTTFLPTAPRMRLPALGDDPAGEGNALPVEVTNQSSLAIASRDLVATGHARAVIQVPNRAALETLAASGGAFRIDPVHDITVTTPGTGQEPGPLPPDLAAQPIVAMVDGGRTARRYEAAEAWREPPLFPAALLDAAHGNHITSLAVHGHAWNNNLPLPALFCRVGTVPAVPRQGAARTNPAQLVAYLDAVIRRHPDTKVWNMSFNECCSVDPHYVSFLGHEFTLLARRYRVLFVISVGNQTATIGNRLAPPADCEAGLVVSGRIHDGNGALAGPCLASLPGPGRQGQLRPDLSYYSTLRMLGGGTATGSSYPTVLISALAAHTFTNLKDPSPDMVRALLLNQTDLATHEHQRGWGSPSPALRPWLCPPGTVTLAWSAKVRPGYNYYWDDIPIPSQIISEGRLKGFGALTVVLNPIVNPEIGENYFATRVTAALQYRSRAGATTRLLGSVEAEDTAPELDARADYHKWQPIRHDARDFSRRPLTYSGDTFRLYARAYARDPESLGYAGNADFGELEVSIVLSLSDGSTSSDIYNGMVVSLGTFVESAVIDQEIEIEN